MGLSKRGWNNVLIFACMGMIIIFNLMGDKLIKNAQGDIVNVLPEQSIILTLEYPDVSIERLGRSWRVTPTNKLTNENAAKIINHWLSLSGEITLSSDSEESGYRVMLWLAGNEQPNRYWVQPQSGYITDILQQKTWKISPSLLSELK